MLEDPGPVLRATCEGAILELVLQGLPIEIYWTVKNWRLAEDLLLFLEFSKWLEENFSYHIILTNDRILIYTKLNDVEILKDMSSWLLGLNW